MYVCMYACTHACMHACMHVFMSVMSVIYVTYVSLVSRYVPPFMFHNQGLLEARGVPDEARGRAEPQRQAHPSQCRDVSVQAAPGTPSLDLHGT